jgi:tetratricopeptide (TPR) repeat protein
LQIKNKENRLFELIIAGIFVFTLISVKKASALDCEQGLVEAKRLYNMAQEQLEMNKKAAESFLLQAIGAIDDCEYSDELKQELYTTLGQLYYKEGVPNKAIGCLEKAIEYGMNIESPNSFPAVLLGNICAENIQVDVTFFPKALLNYKRALEINNFASSALARHTAEEYKQLQEQTTTKEAQIWEMARAKEGRGEWDKALKCYDALILLERNNTQLLNKKNRAQFNVYLHQADSAMARSNFQEAGQTLDKAADTKYYIDGNGQEEFDRRVKKLKKGFKK